MSEPFLAEVRLMGFNFAPRGWAFCDGQIMPINQNQSLYSLLGTTYGGDGRTSFALPDLRGRTPIHTGNSNGGEHHTPGQKAERKPTPFPHPRCRSISIQAGAQATLSFQMIRRDVWSATIRACFTTPMQRPRRWRQMRSPMSAEDRRTTTCSPISR